MAFDSYPEVLHPKKFKDWLLGRVWAQLSPLGKGNGRVGKQVYTVELAGLSFVRLAEQASPGSIDKLPINFSKPQFTITTTQVVTAPTSYGSLKGP